MESIELPRGLDDAHQILLASTEKMVPFFGMLIAGVLLEQWLICLLLLSFLLIKLFRRFRDNRVAARRHSRASSLLQVKNRDHVSVSYPPIYKAA